MIALIDPLKENEDVLISQLFLSIILRFHSSITDEDLMGPSSMISDDPPPYFTAAAKNNMTSSEDMNKNMSKPESDAIFQPNHLSTDNYHPLKSKHTQSPKEYWTVSLKLGKLILLLTVLLLLTMTLPVLGSYHGSMV